MNNYQKISCEDHSIYELVIMRGQSMKVEINGEIIRIKPIDLLTKESQEFLIFIDELGDKKEIRADQISIQR